MDMSETVDFTVKIAEIPLRIRCSHPDERRYFRKFLCEDAPLFEIAPGEAELAAMRSSLAEEHGGAEPGPFLVENNAIHRLLAERFAERGVLLVHGSCLSMDGEAYLFMAPSGTGKSTHARLWREAFGDRVVMINDDKPMLRVSSDGVIAYGTPWCGKHRLGGNCSAPLKAIIRLERGEENRIEPMSSSEAFLLLLQQAYSSSDPALSRRILSLESELIDRVDFYTLRCNMEAGAALTAWSGMNAEIPHPD